MSDVESFGGDGRQVTATVAGFAKTLRPEPHGDRAKQILRDHPEVRALFGPSPVSFGVIVGVVAFQLGLAFALRDQPVWLVAVAAWCVGAFCNHAMYVMIHEAAHNLIFRRRYANELSAILADSINVIPAAISFRTYHLKHHAHQGVLELDADLASPWEARLVGTSSFRKALWLMLFPVFAMIRPARVRSIRLLTGWTLVNWLAVVAVDVLVLWLIGPTALLYLFLSFLFSIGFHPLGARWIQEHYLMSPEQETYSYYGPLNRVAFNVGYHNEHHDFPAIPWNRLPALKRLAPEQYDHLIAHRSWTRLWLRFVFDRHLSLFSRMVRPAPASKSGTRAGQPLADARHAG